MSAQQYCAALIRRSVRDEIRPHTTHMFSRPNIMENGPANQFDSLQVCTHYFHVPCITAVLSYYGEIVVRSKLSTPRLLGDSVLSGNIPLQ